ncbi:MAG: hypothetical protein A2806_02365 [Candidatus Terrybacteria bacterium RIFCSPHIGHO2_01_FULL_48_17]|uniref:Uncharacterized protein n=1 Tax=Candidatus Terrybacteria bacterium RIFCSPHIGHO2_01_FULL_48_17 TaxID=1802362 RepID=A0A1G2PJR4_9BACT|nr:MAG: hypothetical protein A2806_02365 [Candidatus Terrybacteria bacterium RIFCSPHIGHO2_01_FULL_48_17]OHA53586.1 MAG: hypothetical protein A3A30_00320 [Candidatus Terrybacteria bacterium RIFCSPLOWO2_01_FULL_48_14]
MRYFRSSTLLAIVAFIAANAMPFVFGENLNLFSLLLFYWLETAVIGCYNIMKLAIIKESYAAKAVRNFAASWIIALGLYFIFLMVFTQLIPGLEREFPTLKVTLLIFFSYAGSHGVSFWQNFIGKREYKSTTAKEQIKAPAGRLLVLHFAIVIGALVFGGRLSSTIALRLFITLKTLIDLDAHFKEHAVAAKRSQRDFNAPRSDKG